MNKGTLKDIALKPLNIAIGIATVVGMITAVIQLDSRYAKEDDVLYVLDIVKVDIVKEMRSEIIKNRSVMIQNMEREADDLEYEINKLTESGQEVPRYMIDKFKLITRQIKELKQNEPD